MTPSIQEMLSEFLSSLEFATMAREVLAEQDHERLQHYARVILRQLPIETRIRVHSRFAMLRLV